MGRRLAITALFVTVVAGCGGGAKTKLAAPKPPPAAAKPASTMPPDMGVTFGRLFAKDGLSKLSAYVVEQECFDMGSAADAHAMIDGQEHSPEMSMTRDPTPKGFDTFAAWLGKIKKKPGSKVVYARAFDGAKHVGWAALCIAPPAVLVGSDFTTQGVPERSVRLTPAAMEKLAKVLKEANVAFMFEDTLLLTTAPVTAILAAAKDPTITFKQPGT